MTHPATPLDSPLGKATHYADQYDPALLFPIPRAPQRERIGIAGQPRFFGADLWTAFELSWLNLRGKPQLAIAHIMVPCESTHIVESKSFKLTWAASTARASLTPPRCGAASRSM